MSKFRPALLASVRFVASVAAVGLVTALDFRALHVNSATAALSYLLLILGVATRVGLVEAVLSSIAAVLLYNFYFLPPIGTLTIADPQNWVALFVFLITAITASHLSSSARRRALEAYERQVLLERLYAFSRGLMLGDSDIRLPDQAIRQIHEVFGVEDVCFYDPESGSTRRISPDNSALREDVMRAVAESGQIWRSPERNAIAAPVRLGGRSLATLGVAGGSPMPEVALQAVAQLIAIAVERTRAQELATRAEATRENERLKSTLLDALAHEFKTPLTSIKAATSTLLAQRSLNVTERELLTVVDEETDRLTNLVSDSIELARIGSSPVILNRGLESVSDLVTTALTQLRALLEGRDVEVEIPPGLPAIEVDARLVSLVLRQLLDNARKHAPADTRIEVRAYREDATVVIAVKSGGLGIPISEQSRIFEKFYRSRSARERVAGTGLGLAIIREIVAAHGGRVWLESEP